MKFPNTLPVSGLLLLIAGCTYRSGDLLVYNHSDRTICYETLVRRPHGTGFYQVSGGDELLPDTCSSPLTRGSLRYEVYHHAPDTALYVLFYPCGDKPAISKNIWYGAFSAYFLQRFPARMLDSLHWTISYNGKGS